MIGLFHLMQEIQLMLFQKAFDSVVHSKLIHKLSAYDITGNLINWITSFLSNRSQSVRVGSSNTDFG